MARQRRAGSVTLFALALAGVLAGVAACTGGQSPPQASAERPSDPVLLGHAQWCGTNPPSGYCPGGHKR